MLALNIITLGFGSLLTSGLLNLGQKQCNHHFFVYTLPLKNRCLPLPVPGATNSLVLTEDGYCILEKPTSESSSNDVTTKVNDVSSDGYTLLAKEANPDYTGYDEVNDKDLADPLYKVGDDHLGGRLKNELEDDHDYEEPYWEPASKEEELMEQLSKLNVPVIPAKNIE